jgi:hypothetical protein
MADPVNPIVNPLDSIIEAGIKALPAVISALEALAAPDTAPLVGRLKQLLGTESALDAVARVEEEKARKTFEGGAP